MIRYLNAIIIFILICFIYSQRCNNSDGIFTLIMRLTGSHSAWKEFKRTIKPPGQVAEFLLIIALGFFFISGEGY
jgi:hypothetical protein